MSDYEITYRGKVRLMNAEPFCGRFYDWMHKDTCDLTNGIEIIHYRLAADQRLNRTLVAVTVSAPLHVTDLMSYVKRRKDEFLHSYNTGSQPYGVATYNGAKKGQAPIVTRRRIRDGAFEEFKIMGQTVVLHLAFHHRMKQMSF